MVVRAVIPADHPHRTFKGLEQGRKAEKNIPACKQRRKGIGGSPRAFCFAGTQRGMSLRSQRMSPSAGFARIVVPAETRSPTLTVGVHSAPKSTSTREPNLMY